MAAGRAGVNKPTDNDNDTTPGIVTAEVKSTAKPSKNPNWVELTGLSSGTDVVTGTQLRKGVLVRCAEGVCFIPAGKIEDRDGKLTVV